VKIEGVEVFEDWKLKIGGFVAAVSSLSSEAESKPVAEVPKCHSPEGVRERVRALAFFSPSMELPIWGTSG
jgi:hypothetical protein